MLKTLKKFISIWSSTSEEILVSVDWKHLNQYNWHTHSGYAMACIDGRIIYMHCLILPAPIGFVTDHKNRKPLDNRNENLEVVSKTDDAFNRKIFRNNQLKMRGVRLRKDTLKFTAQIHIESKQLYLGQFDTVEQAAAAYQLARDVFTTRM